MSQMKRPTTHHVVVALALAANVLLGAALWSPHVAAHDRSMPLGAEQTTDCPRLDTPGKLMWSFPTVGMPNAPAIDDSGTLYFATTVGNVFGVNCRGEKRWSFNALGGTGRISVGSPVLHSDGAIYLGLGQGTGLLLAITASDGRYRSGTLVQPIETSLVVDPAHRIFVGTRLTARSTGTIGAFGRRSLVSLPGFPVQTNEIGVAPVLLSGNRVVFVSGDNPLAASPPRDGTPTPQAIAPIHRTPTPTAQATSARATSSPSPTTTATSSPAPTDPASPTAFATETSQPSATASSSRWSVFLPLARAEAARGSISDAARGLATGHASQPTRSLPDQPSAPTPSPMPGFREALLHIITDARAPGQAYALSDSEPSSLVATGEVVIVTLEEEPSRLVAIAVDSEPPRILWEHFTSGRIAGSPVLGPLDPATGRVELVYADSTGLLVSLAAPGTPEAGGLPTFNWAIRLDRPILGSPVLSDAGMVYVATINAVHAFSRADGGDGWTFEWVGPVNGDVLSGALALAPNGALIIGTSRSIVAISTESQGLDPEARWPAERHDHRNSGWAEP